MKIANQNETNLGQRLERLVYSADEVCHLLAIGRTTLWRMERLGRLNPIPGIRHKRYAVEEVRRFTLRKQDAA
jgi:hypothetical protein